MIICAAQLRILCLNIWITIITHSCWNDGYVLHERMSGSNNTSWRRKIFLKSHRINFCFPRPHCFLPIPTYDLPRYNVYTSMTYEKLHICSKLYDIATWVIRFIRIPSTYLYTYNIHNANMYSRCTILKLKSRPETGWMEGNGEKELIRNISVFVNLSMLSNQQIFEYH